MKSFSYVVDNLVNREGSCVRASKYRRAKSDLLVPLWGRMRHNVWAVLEEVSAVLSDNIVVGVYGAISNAWMDWRLWLFVPSASWGAQGAGLA
jgi:hypothetical protein